MILYHDYLWYGWWSRSFFFSCAFYNQFLLLKSGWLGFSPALHGSLIDHFTQFRGLGLGGFSNKSRLTFNIIWIYVLFIIRKDRNRRHFHNKTEQLSSLMENIKLQAYWWLKLYYALFDFECIIWRLSHFLCFQTLTWFFLFSFACNIETCMCYCNIWTF